MRAAATMPFESCSVHTSISIMSGRSLSATPSLGSIGNGGNNGHIGLVANGTRQALAQDGLSSTIRTRIMSFSFELWRWR